MTDFVDDPPFFHDLSDFTADVAIAYAPAQIQAGADTIGMSDAAASMMGPRYYREFLFPRQLRVVESIRKAHPEVIVRLHMCRNTDCLISQMRMLPVQIFELDSPTDLAAARAGLGPDRMILGNVSTITDMLQGTPGQVYEACRRCHQICGKAHVVGTGCEMTCSSRWEATKSRTVFVTPLLPPSFSVPPATRVVQFQLGSVRPSE